MREESRHLAMGGLEGQLPPKLVLPPGLCPTYTRHKHIYYVSQHVHCCDINSLTAHMMICSFNHLVLLSKSNWQSLIMCLCS